MESQLINGIFLGVSLGAACGFRAFLPAFLYALAVATGHLETAPAFTWLGSNGAIAVFGAGAAIELAASFLRGADRIMDLAETPLAMVTGSLLVLGSLQNTGIAAAILVPLLTGMLIAGLGQSISSLMRSRALAGDGRFRAGAIEAAGAVVLTVAGILAPPAGGIMGILYLASRWRDIRGALLR